MVAGYHFLSVSRCTCTLATSAKNGGPNHSEIWLRDAEGYTMALAGPEGSAYGN